MQYGRMRFMIRHRLIALTWKESIGTEMTRRARDMMLRLGGEYFLGELWVYPDGRRPSATPTNDYGETVYEEYVPYFYKDLDKYGMKCVVCGDHCRCGAGIRMVRLGSAGSPTYSRRCT